MDYYIYSMGSKSEKYRIVRGRYVAWESQGRGKMSIKRGRVVKFIPAGMNAFDEVPGRLVGAIDRSKKNFKDVAKIDRYLIEVFVNSDGEKIKPVLYCTRASLVHEIPKPSWA